MNTAHMNTTPLTLRVVDSSTLSPLIWEAMAQDCRTAHQYATTTAWSFEGGEAIGLVTGRGATVVTYAIIRLGGDVHIIEARGLQFALQTLGFRSQVS